MICLFYLNQNVSFSKLLYNIMALSSGIIIQSVKFDCISINESMLDISISDSEIAIDNYMIFRKDRNRNGGGVLLYISKSLKPTKIDDTFHTEIVCVKIHIQRFNILICSLYRPPSSLVEYYDKMICDCENIMALGQDMIIMGDLNLNCFQNDFYHAHPLIINLEEYFQLNQLIRLPTRQAGNSNSLLDVIKRRRKNDGRSFMLLGAD